MKNKFASLIRSILTFFVLRFFDDRQFDSLLRTQTNKFGDFVKEVKQVNVKKGKRRYTLLIIRTWNAVYRINLGRHKTDQEVNIIDPGFGQQGWVQPVNA